MEKSIATHRHRLLAELLRQLREEARLTQIELAERLQVGQSTISKFETAQRRLDIIQLESYCGALGISLGELVIRWERKKKEA